MQVFQSLIQVVTCFQVATFCHTAPVKFRRHRDPTSGNQLILILLDAFRWDYFQIEGLQGFSRLIRQGVKTRYMRPVFPTQSYPNHYSIDTGLHVESHGLVGNYMFDPETQMAFKHGRQESDADPMWWNGGEPIWVTARKQGKKTYWYNWFGCEVKIRGHVPDFCLAYGNGSYAWVEHFKSMIDSGLKDIEDDDADVIGIYLQDPDYNGHRFGPFSKELNDSILAIDEGIDYLLDKLEEMRLINDTNIMIMSDHGMTAMNESRLIDLSKYIPDCEWQRLVNGSRSSLMYTMYNIWPHPGREMEVFNKLRDIKNPRLQVYLKDRIPENWHYKNNDKVGAVVVTDDLGWYMAVNGSTYGRFNGTGPLRGGHGFGHREMDMQAMFVASGPDFKMGEADLPPLRTVDLYQMMCHILRITPSPNNGSWETARLYMFTDYNVYYSKIGLVLLALTGVPFLYISLV